MGDEEANVHFANPRRIGTAGLRVQRPVVFDMWTAGQMRRFYDEDAPGLSPVRNY